MCFFVPYRSDEADDNTLFSVDEILNACEEYYGAQHINKIKSIRILHPHEPPDAATDKNSDLSDDKTGRNLNHLPGRILRSSAVVELEESMM